MSKTKGGGSTRNGRDSAAQRLGVKVYDGQVVSHGRGAKIIVYKFRKRANYRKKQGHRQAYTEVKITAIHG